eukprot:SAG11_NODE_4812_length_1758_cov_1.509946_3_plen_189_part_01
MHHASGTCDSVISRARDIVRACAGAQNSERPNAACRTNCRAPSCGDGVVDDGEMCDLAGMNNNDASNGCTSDCRVPRLLPSESNGLVALYDARDLVAGARLTAWPDSVGSNDAELGGSDLEVAMNGGQHGASANFPVLRGSTASTLLTPANMYSDANAYTLFFMARYREGTHGRILQGPFNWLSGHLGN